MSLRKNVNPRGSKKTGSAATNIILTGAQHAYLRTYAFKKGVSVAELIRRSLGETLPEFPRDQLLWGRKTEPTENQPQAIRKASAAGSRAAKLLERQIIADLKSNKNKKRYKTEEEVVVVVPKRRGRPPKAAEAKVVTGKHKKRKYTKSSDYWDTIGSTKPTKAKAAKIKAKPVKPAKAVKTPKAPAVPKKRAYTKRSPFWSTPKEASVASSVAYEIKTAAEIAAAQAVAAQAEVVSHEVLAAAPAAAPAEAPVPLQPEPETLTLPPEMADDAQRS